LLGDRPVYDADSHLMETTGWLHEYADPAVRPLLAELNLAALPDPAVRPDFHPGFYESGWGPQRRDDAEQNLLDRKNWAALGAVDAAERSRALDLFGFTRQFVFATWCWGQFDNEAYGPRAHDRNLDRLYGGAQAHNRGLAEYCRSDPRLMASGMVPLDDPERAVRMTDEVLASGCRGVVIPTSVGSAGERTWSHPDNDGVWARLSEAGVPAVTHIGSGLFNRFPQWMYNNGKQTTFMLGTEGWVIQDLYSNWWTQPLFLCALAVDGVFARFPGLKVAVCEYEVGWVPHFVNRIDGVQDTAVRQNPAEYALPMRASEYIRERVKFAPPPGVQNPNTAEHGTREPWHEVIAGIPGGEKMFMFSSDYPHTEGGSDPIRTFENELVKFGDRADEVRDLFYSANYLEMFGG
jgi:predicted TIM-barrel fold metal-dependent hydrolase